MNFESVNIVNKVIDRKERINLQGAIMKKLLILTMMCALIGSMVALESDPSDVVGYVKYSMQNGKTFIALPMDAGYSMSNEIGDAVTDADQVSYYSAGAGWVSMTKNLFGNWQNQFSVTGGQAIMVRATSTSDFYVAGDMFSPEPNYSLVSTGTKLNSVMVPLSRSDLTSSNLVGDDMVTVDQISYYSPTGWVSMTKNLFGNWQNTFSTEIGMALQVRATSDFNWPVADNDFDGTRLPVSDKQK